MLAGARFERTVQFIGVCLEENANDDDPCSGTRGSVALARHARASGWDLAAVLVLESVGFAGDDVVQSVPPGVPIPVPETGNFIAVIVNEQSAELSDSFVRAVARHQVGLPHVVLAVPGNGELLPDSRRSDHAPFWDEGFQAIMLTDTTNFRNPHYHQASDTLATLNLEFAAKVCRAATGAVLELARPETAGRRVASSNHVQKVHIPGSKNRCGELTATACGLLQLCPSLMRLASGRTGRIESAVCGGKIVVDCFPPPARDC